MDPDTAAELVRATHRVARALERATATLRRLPYAAVALALLNLAHLVARRGAPVRVFDGLLYRVRLDDEPGRLREYPACELEPLG